MYSHRTNITSNTTFPEKKTQQNQKTKKRKVESESPESPALSLKTPSIAHNSVKNSTTAMFTPGKRPQRVEVKTPKPMTSPSNITDNQTKTIAERSMNIHVATPRPVSKTPTRNDPLKKLLPNGLIIEDLILGHGADSQVGKKVRVKYIGRLSSGSIFDSSLNKPFTFRLGVGQVIKGWDIGIRGMRVGGKRRLTIPPKLAYGSEGALPSIPPNSTLVFEVELVEA